ncbi:hypothetical protein [Thiohalorhabdus methylotrophus]|uniref:Uncharacterized protein n=1 Tax=Thiohalorhabdus methylotrophus TaxID=3242694 RepID=A0ABV4TY17_9GAMM
MAVKQAPGPTLIPVVLKLLAGDYTESELVSAQSTPTVEVTCGHDFLLSLDGELHRMREARFAVVPGALRFVAAEP